MKYKLPVSLKEKKETGKLALNRQTGIDQCLRIVLLPIESAAVVAGCAQRRDFVARPPKWVEQTRSLSVDLLVRQIGFRRWR